MWPLNTIEKECYVLFEEQLMMICKMKNGKKIAIWGASVRGIIVGMILEKLGIYDFFFIDNDVKKQGENLSGHKIYSFEKIDKRNVFYIVSMEYSEEVANNLIVEKLVEKKDFYCMKSSMYEDYMKRLKLDLNEEILMTGASIWHTVPVKDVMDLDLTELVEKKCGNKIKILGMTCLGMRNIYHSIRIEAEKNNNLKQVLFIASWETLTPYHHMLPRTQKPQLIQMMAEYAKEVENVILYEKLKIELEIASERAKDYVLENQFSPDRLNNGISIEEKLKLYADMGILKELDDKCEEVTYLCKTIKYLTTRNIKSVVIFEPVNQEVYVELYGEVFESFYCEKCSQLRALVEENGGALFDASFLLNKKEFSYVNLVNEAIYTSGRELFSDYIVKIMNEKRNYYWPATSINTFDYLALTEISCRHKDVLREKNIFIFGAGIRGCIIKKILEQKGFRIKGFIDNNMDKFGGYIEETPIYNKYKIKEIVKTAIIINGVENAENINNQLIESGFEMGKNILYIHTDIYKEYVREFKDDNKNYTLIMGDCGLSTVAIKDSHKISLGDMLKEYFKESKVLAIHGLGMRAHYNILEALIAEGKKPGTAIVMVNFDTFTGKQHLLPRSQHVPLLKMVASELSKVSAELSDYINITVERSQNFQIEFFVDEKEKEEISSLQAKVYLKLNYMYNLDENNEGILYLKKYIRLCKSNEINVIPFIPPVNYMLGEQVIGIKFKQRYDNNRMKLDKIIKEEGEELLDLSYTMVSQEFCDLCTPDETLNYAGRIKAKNLILSECERRTRF